MGTDRSHEYKTQCACGGGLFEIDYCTPDHGWQVATPEWYESRITCEGCSAKYEIQQFGRKFYLVDRSQIDAKEADRQEMYAAVQALELAAKAEGIDTALASILDEQKSLAATHRFLVHAGLSHESLPLLRKRWTGGANWVQRNFSGYQVTKFLKALGRVNPQLEAQAAAIEVKHTSVNKRPAPAGEPIYVATDDA